MFPVNAVISLRQDDGNVDLTLTSFGSGPHNLIDDCCEIVLRGYAFCDARLVFTNTEELTADSINFVLNGFL